MINPGEQYCTNHYFKCSLTYGGDVEVIEYLNIFWIPLSQYIINSLNCNLSAQLLLENVWEHMHTGSSCFITWWYISLHVLLFSFACLHFHINPQTSSSCHLLVLVKISFYSTLKQNWWLGRKVKYCSWLLQSMDITTWHSFTSSRDRYNFTSATYASWYTL